MSGLLPLFVQHVLPVLLTVLSPIVAIAAGKWAQYVSAKANAAKYEVVAAKLTGIVATVIGDIEQTMRAQFEAAASDGEITPLEAKALRDAAVAKIKAYLGDKGLKEVSKAIGIPENFVTDYLISVLESRIQAANSAKAFNMAVPRV